MQSTILVILPMWAVFFALSLRLQILPKSTWSQQTVKKTSWSNPSRQTRICYIFWLWVIIKALLKQISLYLLSHFCIRMIILTCPDNKSARNHQPNHVCLQNHTNHNDARPTLFQLKSSLPFSLFLFVWRLESTTTKPLLRHLHCRGSPLFKSRQKKLCSKWRDNTDAFVALQLGQCIRTNRQQCALLTSFLKI